MAFLFQDLAAGKSTSGMANIGFMKKGTGIKPANRDSRQWFREKAQAVTAVNPRAVLGKLKQRSVTRMKAQDIGRMFMYFYDPKHKETLPYYDQFPVIFVIETYPDGFLGINLHYLPPIYRAKLMDALYQTINNTKYDETTKLRINYRILGASARMRWFKPCVKRYLYNHVKTNMVEVPVTEWDYCAMLPLERFKKQRAIKVQKDSVNSVGSY
jgi:hypothetical protein